MQGVILISTVGVALAVSPWQKEEPSEWTSEDVYQILNNSPWSKAVQVNTAASSPGYGTGRNGGRWGSGGQMPGGGLGRGGGLGGGGMGRGNGGYPRGEQPTR